MAHIKRGYKVSQEESGPYIYGLEWASARQNFYSMSRPVISQAALKFVRKAKEQLGLDLFPCVHYFRHGHWQRSSGAWRIGFHSKGNQVSCVYGTHDLLRVLIRNDMKLVRPSYLGADNFAIDAVKIDG